MPEQDQAAGHGYGSADELVSTAVGAAVAMLGQPAAEKQAAILAEARAHVNGLTALVVLRTAAATDPEVKEGWKLAGAALTAWARLFAHVEQLAARPGAAPAPRES